MEFPERFRWGWCPTTGKKGDLMFAQHMLAVCKPGGMVATVMPHGVLFRGGAEKEIRQKFLEQDLIEAVIGLPPNLFYGAGIPACILVMRPNLTGQISKPEQAGGPARPGAVHQRRRRVPRRPGAELPAARARREDRIHVRALRGYPRLCAACLARGDPDPANDCNLNIRRYVDNSPPPEPHDVRAHLSAACRWRKWRPSGPCSTPWASIRAHALRRARRATLLTSNFAPALTDRGRRGCIDRRDAPPSARSSRAMLAFGIEPLRCARR